MQKINSSIKLQQRPCNPQLLTADCSLHPVLQRVFSARDIQSFAEVEYALKALTPPHLITHLQQAAEILMGHLQQQSNILVFGDYDADGATSTALCVRALILMGHENINFLLPDRFKDGYGVSENVAKRIINLKPDLVITVDTGISSFKGLSLLKQENIEVIVTDHHLPADELPDVSVIVNPNAFNESAGKNLAGVGVAFYLMLELRRLLRKVSWFDDRPEPNLAECLDLVAIGTVADLVILDYNNRILVNEGLKRLRAGACSAGIRKLIEVSGKMRQSLSSQDIGFSIAPRLNAAGRLDDMTIGVQTLLIDDETVATQLAYDLEDMNKNRREIQSQMQDQALAMLPDVEHDQNRYSFVLYQQDWHEGVVGIIASKIKDVTYRPVISFASAGDGLLKGSGRSVTGVHLRDMLDLVDKSEPDLIIRFGGHAMAAGLTIKEQDLSRFTECFEKILQQHVDPVHFNNTLLSDGEINGQEMTLELAKILRDAGPWGQRFPAPSFDGQFKVLDKRILSNKHLKFVLTAKDSHSPIDAILFFATDQQLKTNYQDLHIFYELSVNDFRGEQNPQLMIRHIF
ncbi:MAG: single-stranded-DNA-specific exonuclease RecJ [Gammaproteobacteria bacterium]|jgi:single-stranded-DNA-specific exonuclease|nr:single-stranded-DNA-specific exonuclease RecJ [Gammaproteobacteria bacterium]MBT3722205.1 single-stranded-DNA-specific exonuclease RecJ [Gammaproteobacteria bacterium]MBT4078503.1 single-stranded-DNA-specific exonuclease RecJ [Gammaproteobacteria bacterium]MBT4193522.1 single-stranded-DNA-specific exonuclease RecJ [Gammaproteobacteria bacterium]MBT4452183.1 single-stranded-DNA-specific exonuclease RecJ [Gammaproteobacteria bacterium]